MQIQKSVYVKLLHNSSFAENEMLKLRQATVGGAICALPLSLTQFVKMTTLRGKPFNMKRFSDDILYV